MSNQTNQSSQVNQTSSGDAIKAEARKLVRQGISMAEALARLATKDQSETGDIDTETITDEELETESE